VELIGADEGSFKAQQAIDAVKRLTEAINAIASNPDSAFPSGLDDVARCIEIGLAYFKMNDVTTLCLERFRFHQHFKRCLCPESRHAPG
jgi:hypothetical protein